MGILLVLRPKIDPQQRKHPKQSLAAPPYTQLGQRNGAWELHSGFWAAQLSELRRVSDSGPRIDKSRKNQGASSRGCFLTGDAI